MDLPDKSRLEKFLGMLGSQHDGERANAAGFISRLAVDRKLTIPDLIRKTLGVASGASSSSSGSTLRERLLEQQIAHERLRAQSRERDLNRTLKLYQDQLIEAQRSSAKARAEVMTLRKQLEAKTNPFGFSTRSTVEPDQAGTDGLLDMLGAAAKHPRLNAWERSFAEDVAARYDDDDQLSDKQRAAIEKILRKAGL